MNDQELNRILKSAAPPQRDDEYWADFPDQVARNLNRPARPAPRAARWPARLVWATGFAVVCVCAGILIGQHFRPPASAADNGQVLENAKLIREVMAMFPHRLRAIVKDESGLRLVLSDADDVPASPPLWVKVCAGERCTTLVTFSGQELQVAGQKMTVLCNGSGEIILEGNRFLWSSTERTYAGRHLKIQAKNIGPAVM